MKTQLLVSGLFICILYSCQPSATSLILKQEAGQAIIQHEKGSFSEPMDSRAGFEALKDNEKLYLSPGRVKLTEPLELKGLQNIEIIGNNTSLVAKVDMPVVTFKEAKGVRLSGLLVVHEIGEWCAQNCVEFYNTSDIQIEECTFDGSGYFGLALTSVQNVQIKNSKFFNCEYGLAAWSSRNISLKGNSFSKNRASNIMVNAKEQFSNDFESENTFE